MAQHAPAEHGLTSLCSVSPLAVNTTLPTFAATDLYLLSTGAQQQTHHTPLLVSVEGTDRLMLNHFINPVLHTMWAASKTYEHTQRELVSDLVSRVTFCHVGNCGTAHSRCQVRPKSPARQRTEVETQLCHTPPTLKPLTQHLNQTHSMLTKKRLQ